VNEPDTPERDFVFRKTILALDSVDALLACLGMAHAKQEHHLPYEPVNALEGQFLEKRRPQPESSSCKLEPKAAPELRSRLMEGNGRGPTFMAKLLPAREDRCLALTSQSSLVRM
jgi:hypothetical protein